MMAIAIVTSMHANVYVWSFVTMTRVVIMHMTIVHVMAVVAIMMAVMVVAMMMASVMVVVISMQLLFWLLAGPTCAVATRTRTVLSPSGTPAVPRAVSHRNGIQNRVWARGLRW